MRKIIALLLVVVLAVFVCSACSDKPKYKMGKDVTDAERYAVSGLKEQPELQFTLTDVKKNIGVFYMGRVENVPICYSESVDYAYKFGEAFPNLAFDAEDLTSERHSYALSTAISELVSTRNAVPANVGAFALTVTEKDSIDPDYNIAKFCELGYAEQVRTAYSFGDSYAYLREYIDAGNLSALKYNFALLSDAGNYRISLFAKCDLYAMVVFDFATSSIQISYDISVVKEDFHFAVDYSADVGFPADNTVKNSVVYPTETLSSSKVFDTAEFNINYVLNDGTFEGEPTTRFTIATLALPVPTKGEYFTFAGWYFDQDLTRPADETAISRAPKDYTLYAAWATKQDVVNIDGFLGVTSNIVGTDTGRITVVNISADKLAVYSAAGYRAKITLYYTAGVPFEYEETKDSSFLRVQLGYTKDTSDTNFTSMVEKCYDPMEAGQYQDGTLTFTSSLSSFTSTGVGVRLTIRSNDSSVLGICGRDAGNFTNIRVVIDYVKE